MERMDKVLDCVRTDKDIIVEYKKDGEKYKATIPLFLSDGSRNPQAEEYIDLYLNETIKYNKFSKGIAIAGLCFSVGLVAFVSSDRYKLYRESYYEKICETDEDGLLLPGFLCGALATMTSDDIVTSSKNIKKLKKEKKARK